MPAEPMDSDDRFELRIRTPEGVLSRKFVERQDIQVNFSKLCTDTNVTLTFYRFSVVYSTCKLLAVRAWSVQLHVRIMHRLLHGIQPNAFKFHTQVGYRWIA